MIKPTSLEPLIAPGLETLNLMDLTPYFSFIKDAIFSARVS